MIHPPTAYAGPMTPYQFDPFVSPNPTTRLPTSGTFCDYIHNLASWETTLLSSYHLHQDDDVFQYTKLSVYNTIRYASDGSVEADAGTYGWMAALLDGTRVVHCNGDVTGYPIHPYRAELSGLLSAIRFHIRTHKFCLTSIPHATFYTDSESSIKKINTYMASSPQSLPRQTQSSDWDLLQLVVSSLQALPSYDLIFVPSHQDKKTPYEQLHLPAQLNIQADHLAAARHSTCNSTSYTPFYPQSGVQLEFHNFGTITGPIKPHILRRAHVAEYESYLCSRFGWDATTFQSLDRQTLKLALRRHKSRGAHLVKLVNNLLPTNHWIHRYTPTVSSDCPYCPTQEEDFPHILRCPHASCRTWYSSLCDRLVSLLQTKKVDPMLGLILFSGLWNFMDGTPCEDTDMLLEYRTLVRSQHTIGWANLFRGHISVHWSLLQDDYAASQRSRGVPNPTPGPAFSVALLDVLWTSWFEVWEARNAVIHNNQLHHLAHRRRQEMKGACTALYECKEKVLHKDRALFRSSVDCHLSEPYSTIQQWIATHSATIQSSIRLAQSWAIQNVPPITAYFPRVPAQPSSA